MSDWDIYNECDGYGFDYEGDIVELGVIPQIWKLVCKLYAREFDQRALDLTYPDRLAIYFDKEMEDNGGCTADVLIAIKADLIGTANFWEILAHEFVHVIQYKLDKFAGEGSDRPDGLNHWMVKRTAGEAIALLQSGDPEAVLYFKNREIEYEAYLIESLVEKTLVALWGPAHELEAA
jgi:hypothetical protein